MRRAHVTESSRDRRAQEGNRSDGSLSSCLEVSGLLLFIMVVMRQSLPTLIITHGLS